MRFRSLLLVPLAIALASTPAVASPVTVSYLVGAPVLAGEDVNTGGTWSDSKLRAAGFFAGDGNLDAMRGILTFTLPTFDYAWTDPKLGVYVDPFAELHMTFSGPYEPAFTPTDFLSVDLFGPLVATIHLTDFDAQISLSMLGQNGLRAFFGTSAIGLPNDSANALLVLDRLQYSDTFEFAFDTPDYGVIGQNAGFSRLLPKSVPEPSTFLLLSLCFTGLAAKRYFAR